MMKISLNEISEFLHCPMFYRFKHEDEKIRTPYLDLYEKYDSDIRKFMYAYHSQLQNGDAVDGSTVKRIWGSLWIGEKNKQDLIFTDTGDKRDTWNEKRKQGIENLMTYHSKGPKSIGTPVLVNHEFEVDISKGITLTGNFELIQELNGKVELVTYIPDSRKITGAMFRKDMKITGLSYAFKETFGDKQDNTVAYLVDKNRRVQTARTEKDYKIFQESVKNIAISIRNDIFYINPNPRCISCLYKDKCDNFISKKDML